MNLEEKRKANKDFIKNKFTYGTYAVLLVFHQNITRMINLIELRIIFLKRIESGEVKHTLPEEELTQKKVIWIQFTTLSDNSLHFCLSQGLGTGSGG